VGPRASQGLGTGANGEPIEAMWAGLKRTLGDAAAGAAVEMALAQAVPPYLPCVGTAHGAPLTGPRAV